LTNSDDYPAKTWAGSRSPRLAATIDQAARELMAHGEKRRDVIDLRAHNRQEEDISVSTKPASAAAPSRRPLFGR
jgi:hypothetical protein